MPEMSNETMELANSLMTAYRKHTVDLMDNLIKAMDTLKVSINDLEGNPHDIILRDDVIGLIEAVKDTLSGHNGVSVTTADIDSNG